MYCIHEFKGKASTKRRCRDVAERVLEIVLASLDEPRKPKPCLTRIKRNLNRRGVLSRS